MIFPIVYGRKIDSNIYYILELKKIRGILGQGI